MLDLQQAGVNIGGSAVLLSHVELPNSAQVRLEGGSGEFAFKEAGHRRPSVTE